MGIRMHHKRAKSARLASGVAVFLFSLLVIYRIATSVEPGVPDKTQLVTFYQATAQNSLFQRDRWIVEANSQRTIEGAISKTAARKYVYKYTVYRDRDRIDARKKRIRMDFPEEKDRIDKTRSQHIILYGRVYSYARWVPEGEPPRFGIIASNDLTRRVINSAGVDALALAGYMLGDKKPLAEILAEESSVLHTQPSMQMANGFPTYVLEATTPYGHYTVWMDPNCGYSPRRVIVERGPEDLYDGKPVSAPPPPPIPGLTPLSPPRPTFERARFVLDILKIKEIGDGFTATEGTTTTTHVYSDGSIERTYAISKLTLVDLNPDFNDIPDAFVLDVPDGTRVFDVDFPTGKSKWQNGKMVPLVIEPMSLLGKPLPELKDLKVDLSSTDLGDKMILVCFFDMQQRPSRNCIMQLAKQSKQLKQKGVTVVAVQASNVDENELKQWVKNYNIPFPVGIVQSDVEKTKFAWCVKSLPWLILTNWEQTVIAEGFGIAELDEELKKNIDTEHTIQKNKATPTKPVAQTGLSDSAKSFLDAEAILSGWESSYAGIRIMRVSYCTRLVDYQPPAKNPDIDMTDLVKYQHVERVEDGKRFHIRFSKAEDGFNRPENLREHTFDGKITREYSAREKHGSIVAGLIGRNTETMNDLKIYMLLRRRLVGGRNASGTYLIEDPNSKPDLSRTLVYAISRSMVSVLPELEPVAGQLCHVVEVVLPGKDHNRIPRQIKQVFWMAHDKGMCLMKYHWYWDNTLDREIEVEQIAMEKMDNTDVWYPKKAYRTIFSDEIGTIKYELTVTEFIPNVEVDEKTFRFDFPKGTYVFDRVREIAGIDLPKEPPSLVGKPIPELDGIKIDIPLEDAKAKNLLVCFWDMQQRPSRNCIRELAKRAEELKEKGVAVIAVQASEVDENELNEWVKKYNIPFPVGIVQSDVEKTHFTWGVKSLPWLILTNSQHIVHAEDFSLTELDEKISKVAQKQN